MRSRHFTPALFAAGLAVALAAPFAAPAAAAAHDAAAHAAEGEADGAAEAKGKPRRFETSHKITVEGQTLSYRAIVGETILKDDKGEDAASIFFTTYILDGYPDPTGRPVAFIFNGGPGSASLWLHLGVFGPKRVKLPGAEDPQPMDDGAAPFDLRDNPYTLLKDADLVFIDPVGTGFSKTLGEASTDDYWGVTEDARSLRHFVRLWLMQHKRWNSPKYLMGESYGTTRSAALIRELERGWTDIAINGVVLISTVLNFGLDATDPGNDVGYVGLLPTFAATAWYHEKVDRARWNGELESFLDDARSFAVDVYLPALIRGQLMTETRRKEIAGQLSGFIGLDQDYLERSHLRVPLGRFMRELRRDEGLSVGRLDSRFVGVEPDGVGEMPEYDPSAYGIDGAYTGAMLDYFTRNLGVALDDDYSTLGGVRGWNWDTGYPDTGGDNSYVNVAPNLERAMRQNKDLRVLALNGYYDAATPFFATEMTFAQPGFDRSRVELKYYEAGHMMYIHEPSLIQMAKDVKAFVQGK